MKDLSPQDRPREKLERAGAAALGDNELLALLVGHGTAKDGALTIANRVLAASRGVHGLTRIHRDELAAFDGVGAAVAARILAAIELGRRTLTIAPAHRLQLASPREMAGFLLPRFGAFPTERFGLVLLDVRHRLIRTHLLSVGSAEASLVHPREVFREAALAAASAIVLFHNHPSGDAAATSADYLVTRRLTVAGELMGIEVIDHLILADNTYYSFKEAGKL